MRILWLFVCAVIIVSTFAFAQHNHGSSGNRPSSEETRTVTPRVSAASKLQEGLNLADATLQRLKESVGVNEARNKALHDYIAVLTQIREGIRKAEVDDFRFQSAKLQAMKVILDHKNALKVLIEMAPADVKPSFEGSLASLDLMEKQLVVMSPIEKKTAQ